jgi:hypothetical protein
MQWYVTKSLSIDQKLNTLNYRMCGWVEMTHFSQQQAISLTIQLFFPPIMCSSKLHFCLDKHNGRRKVTVSKLLLEHLNLGNNKFTKQWHHQNSFYPEVFEYGESWKGSRYKKKTCNIPSRDYEYAFSHLPVTCTDRKVWSVCEYN